LQSHTNSSSARDIVTLRLTINKYHIYELLTNVNGSYKTEMIGSNGRGVVEGYVPTDVRGTVFILQDDGEKRYHVSPTTPTIAVRQTMYRRSFKLDSLRCHILINIHTK